MYDRYVVVSLLSLAGLALGVELFRSGMEAHASSSGSEWLLVRVLHRVATSSLTWWSLLVLALYLLEKFDVGVHSLPWHWRRRRKISLVLKGGWTNGSTETTDGYMVQTCCSRHASNGTVPSTFHDFIRSQVIPSFRMQCSGHGTDSEDFAVLVLTHISSLEDVGKVPFRQITFNGKPIVDSRLTTYPEKYRYDNYVAARSSETKHPEALIAGQVPSLLSAYGRAERSYLRNPTPKLGILYTRTMPCDQCTEEIIKSLGGVCRERTVLAYSEEDMRIGSAENRQRLRAAGFTVVRISPH